MAEQPCKQVQSLAEGVGKELTCAVCLSRYNQPKILPCLHIYCRDCLDDMTKKSLDTKKRITCPQCKVVHEIPTEGVDGFTTFFTINNLLELLHIHESSEQKSVAELIKCTSGLDEDPATARCLTCSDYLCESCCKIHQKQRLSKNHIVKTLEEIKQSDRTTGARSLHKRQHCPEHEDELLKLYCKTCKKVICRDCALVTHREHEYTFVREVRMEIQKILEEKISEVQAKEVEFQSHQKCIDNLLKVSREAAKSSKDLVNKTIDEVIEALEHRRTELVAEVETTHETEVKQISAKSDSLALSLVRLSDSIRFTRQLLDNGDNVEVAAVGDQTAETLTSLTQLSWDKCKLKPSLLRPVFESLKEDVAKFGRLLHAVQPSDVILTNAPSEVFVERKFHFEVCLRKEVSERGYDALLQATISCPTSWDMPPIKVKKEGFNLWTVSFTPDEAGKYEITLKVDGTAFISHAVNVVGVKFLHEEIVSNNRYDQLSEVVPLHDVEVDEDKRGSDNQGVTPPSSFGKCSPQKVYVQPLLYPTKSKKHRHHCKY